MSTALPVARTAAAYALVGALAAAGIATAAIAQTDLQPRFSNADVDPSAVQVETIRSAEPIAAGPQYRLSDHATLGGSLTPPDIIGPDQHAERARYVIGLRTTF